MKNMKIFIIVFLLALFSCKQSDSSTSIKKVAAFDSTLDSIIYSNYLNAAQNGSTLQYFLVVTVKDLNSGEIREICTKGCFLLGALHREYDLDYSIESANKIEKLVVDNKKRYFEFNDTAAINNLSTNYYSIEELNTFEETHNIDSLAKNIRKEKYGSVFQEDKMMRIVAHSLFNRGILTGENNCFGGMLIHIDNKFLEERNERIKRLIKKNDK